jgi:hypothetical protein
MYLNVHWRLQENGTILLVVYSEPEGNTPPAEAVRALLPCSKETYDYSMWLHTAYPLVSSSESPSPALLPSMLQGVVRAHCDAAGWVIEPVDAAGSACNCTYFSRVDLRGDIPKVSHPLIFV